MIEENHKKQSIIQNRILNEWGGWINFVYTAEQLQQKSIRVPSHWLQILSVPPSEGITELWNNAHENLPRFVEYLKESTLSLTIAEGSIGFVLIYHIKNWEETEIGEYEDGFMLAGLPTPADKICAFEKIYGKIPSALKSLWQVHGFVLLKSGAILASINNNDAAEQFCGSPVLLGIRNHPDNPQDKYECLAIADAWKQLPVCLTRRTGMAKWEDFLVLADKHGDEVSPTARTNIDDLLTDWTFSEWESS